MNVTYIEKQKHPIAVVEIKLDGVLVGWIKQERLGFRYWPLGSSLRTAGDVYSTIDECKTSLEDDNVPEFYNVPAVQN